MIRIAPSMLAADFLHLEKDVEMVNANADLFHLDVMDGVLVPNISYGFPIVEAIARKAEKPLDVHLMIVNPEKYVERFAKAGASMISFHLEAAEAAGTDAAEILDLIHKCGVKAGITANPDMPVEKLFPFIGKADFIMLMSVFAGFGGQKFIDATYDRVCALKKEIDARGAVCEIEVDGGITTENAAAVIEAGAEILVAGSSVFKAEDPGAVINALRG